MLKDLGDIYRCAFLEEKEGKKNCLNKAWNGSADFELSGRILWLCLWLIFLVLDKYTDVFLLGLIQFTNRFLLFTVK